MDITSSNNGILIPRVALSSASDITTVVNPNAPSLAVSTLVYNTGTAGLAEAGFYYWSGAIWVKLIDNTPATHMGKAIINSTGTVTVTGVPFRPARISFTAFANVDAYDLSADNGVANNNNTKENTFGGMQGYAFNNGGSISQQVIFNGGSGSSINDISRYASSSHCIGLRYANNNGDNLGLTNASLTSFNSNGFTLNVANATDPVVVLYAAYRY